jgi:pyruvate,water dikinase
MAPTLGSPTWREKPEIVQELIEVLLSDTSLLNSEESFNQQKVDYEDAKRQIEKRLKPSKYHKFEQALESAREAVIVREEGLFYLEKLTACLRRLALKLGSLLAEKSLNVFPIVL